MGNQLANAIFGSYGRPSWLLVSGTRKP